MKPSSRRMRAISSFVRLVGTLTVSWRAPAALRTRVSMSATGSFGIPMPFGRAFLGGVAGLLADPAHLLFGQYGHLLPHQLDFVTPGSSPISARSRKQIRQRPNVRMY